MATAFLFHETFLKHDTGPHHPENAERLRAILRGLKIHGLWDQIEHRVPVPALEEHILLAHTKKHFDYIKECAARGGTQIDPDTRVSSVSFDAAMLAAGAAIEAVSSIMGKQYSNAFAAVRPPGHHATADRAMGFCLFNNVAIAARYLVRQYHLKRVLIVDWDVHHGNGTQDIFYNDPSVVYVSLHLEHHYPGTGWEHEKGEGAADGTSLNVPLNGRDPVLYEQEFQRALNQVESFKPEFILISCGFDAHARDPLGTLGLTNETYAHLTEMVFDLALKCGHQRVFSILEGGYDYEALADAAAAHVSVLIERGSVEKAVIQ